MMSMHEFDLVLVHIPLLNRHPLDRLPINRLLRMLDCRQGWISIQIHNVHRELSMWLLFCMILIVHIHLENRSMFLFRRIHHKLDQMVAPNLNLRLNYCVWNRSNTCNFNLM